MATTLSAQVSDDGCYGNRPYLEVKDDGPHQPQGQLWVALDNLF